MMLVTLGSTAGAQRNSLPDAKIRWDRLCQMRKEKFDHILPEAMRENGIDMWIVAQKEGPKVAHVPARFASLLI